jgi:hypothetical protein
MAKHHHPKFILLMSPLHIPQVEVNSGNIPGLHLVKPPPPDFRYEWSKLSQLFMTLHPTRARSPTVGHPSRLRGIAIQIEIFSYPCQYCPVKN